MVSLRLVPVSGNPIEVTADPSLVGRDPSCEIVATEGSVSRRHARLERRAGAWWVVDQGSANGTYVNAMKVAETALKNGQELRFGALVYKVEIGEDPDATVASPVLSEETVMAETAPGASPPAPPPPVPPAPSTPEPPAPPTAEPPAPPPPVPTPAPSPPGASDATPRSTAGAPPPPPVPQSSGAPTPPPTPPRPPASGRGRAATPSPVPQMSGGPPPDKKGRGPFFWILVGCCGCLLLAVLLGGLLGGSLFVMTKGAADAAHAWLGDVREGRMDEAAAGATDQYRSRIESGEAGFVLMAIEQSTDATLPSRSMNNDRAVLTGVLTGGPEPAAIVIHLVKEGGLWKVDDVRLDEVRSFGS